MRISAILTSMVAAAALSGCGAQEEGTITTEEGQSGEYRIDSETGEASMTVETPEGDVTMRTGADVPVDLPAGFTLIDGAEVLNNITIDQAGEKGTLITFQTSQSPAQIKQHYRAQAEAAGITIQIETDINGGAMLGGENEATGTTFSITAYPGEEGTTGQLTISEGLN